MDGSGILKVISLVLIADPAVQHQMFMLFKVLKHLKNLTQFMVLWLLVFLPLRS